MRKALFVLAILMAAVAAAQTQPAAQANVPQPQEQTPVTKPAKGFLYKVSFVQAAPGKLLELIDLLKDRNARADHRTGSFFMMRHSQGDRWDLMLLAPAGSYSVYYSPDSIRERNALVLNDEQKIHDAVAWQEDLWVYGPDIEILQKYFIGGGYSFYHVEIFQSLAGKQTELVQEREMENEYLRRLNQPTNLVFVRDQGAAWDCFTIGFYRDLQHYAESAKTTPEDADKAAKAAGFESAKAIGPYLRTLIALHHDTLAVAVK
jgi:hypothetical protein